MTQKGKSWESKGTRKKTKGGKLVKKQDKIKEGVLPEEVKSFC